MRVDSNEVEVGEITVASVELARFVGVSDRIEDRIRAALPHRGRDIINIPYGVPVAERPPVRDRLEGRPVRLIYTGRIEQKQKRVMTLVELALQLEQRGIAYELEFVGDGPAARELDAAIAGMSHVRHVEPLPPAAGSRYQY